MSEPLRHTIPVILCSVLLTLVCKRTSAQYLVNPGRTQSEPIIDMGSDAHIACGVRFYNLVNNGTNITDFDLQIQLVATPKDQRVSTLISGTIATITPTADGGNSRINNKPADMYFFVEGIADPIKITKIESGIPDGYLGGVVATTDADQATALFAAVMARTPILAHFKLDSSSRTQIVRIVSNMSPDQESALNDCFDRLIARINKSGQKPGAAQTRPE